MRSIDRQTILQHADILDTASRLGIPISGKSSGRRISVLCPAHNDRHFGSCYIDTQRQTWHCFACHAGGNVVDLVMAANNWDRKDGKRAVDALKILASMNGLSENDYTKEESDDDDSNEEQAQIPNREELDLIGLNDAPFWPDTVMDDETGELVSRGPCLHPLREMAKSEPAVFRDMVRRKCDEAEQKYRYAYALCARCHTTAFTGEAIRAAGQQTLLLAICEAIRKVQKVRIRYAT